MVVGRGSYGTNLIVMVSMLSSWDSIRNHANSLWLAIDNVL